MPPGASLDWSTALILAGITLLEGFRRIPAGTTIVRRTLAGLWNRELETTTGGVRLVSWLSPFLLHLVVLPSSTTESRLNLRRRWRRTRQWLPFIQLLGAAEWLLLVIGVPFALARWGWMGLLLAVFALVSASLLLVMLSACSLEDAGLPRREIIRRVRGLLSPFAAPRAAEVVAETALAGAAPLEVLRLLLQPAEYSAVLRPLAYDVVYRGSDAALLATVPAKIVRATLDARPAGAEGVPFCPRCAQTYQAHVGLCRDCGGIALTS